MKKLFAVTRDERVLPDDNARALNAVVARMTYTNDMSRAAPEEGAGVVVMLDVYPDPETFQLLRAVSCFTLEELEALVALARASSGKQ